MTVQTFVLKLFMTVVLFPKTHQPVILSILEGSYDAVVKVTKWVVEEIYQPGRFHHHCNSCDKRGLQVRPDTFASCG